MADFEKVTGFAFTAGDSLAQVEWNVVGSRMLHKGEDGSDRTVDMFLFKQHEISANLGFVLPEVIRITNNPEDTKVIDLVSYTGFQTYSRYEYDRVIGDPYSYFRGEPPVWQATSSPSAARSARVYARAIKDRKRHTIGGKPIIATQVLPISQAGTPPAQSVRFIDL